MKILIIGIGVIVVFAGGYLLFGREQAGSQSSSSSQGQQEQEFAMVQRDIDAGSLLVDVRTPEEYKSGHISGSVNFELFRLQSGQMPEVDKSKKMYVYCRSGNRSAEAKSILEKAGFTSVEDLGAIGDVQKMGGKKV